MCVLNVHVVCAYTSLRMYRCVDVCHYVTQLISTVLCCVSLHRTPTS